MSWKALNVCASNSLSTVRSLPSSFASVAWGHETEDNGEHFFNNLDDTSLIMQALVMIFVVVYSFRKNTLKQRVPRNEQAVPSRDLMAKRTEFLDCASTQIYIYSLLYIGKVYFTIPGLGWIVDQEPSNTFVVTAMRQFGSSWMHYYRLNVIFLLFRVCIMMFVFDNRLHSRLKVAFTHAAQITHGENYQYNTERGNNIAKGVAFYTDSVKLVVVFFFAWPVVWCLKDTYIGLVFCGFFMVFYYEILTILNNINAFYGSFSGLYISLFKAVMQVCGMARAARSSTDRRRERNDGRAFPQAGRLR